MNRLAEIYSQCRWYLLKDQVDKISGRIKNYKNLQESLPGTIDKEGKLLSLLKEKKDGLRKQLLIDERDELEIKIEEAEDRYDSLLEHYYDSGIAIRENPGFEKSFLASELYNLREIANLYRKLNSLKLQNE